MLVSITNATVSTQTEVLTNQVVGHEGDRELIVLILVVNASEIEGVGQGKEVMLEPVLSANSMVLLAGLLI